MDASILFYSYSLSCSLSDSAASVSAALFLNNSSFLLHFLFTELFFGVSIYLSQNEALAYSFCLAVQIQRPLCTFGVTVSGSMGILSFDLSLRYPVTQKDADVPEPNTDM